MQHVITNADVVLTHAYFLADDPKEQQIMKPYAPLGLLYLSAYLKRAGFAVEVFDSTFEDRTTMAARLAATPGGVLGVYTNLMTRASVLWVIDEARRHGWTVVCGGPESANYPAEYLARGAAAVVIGEGEETLAELLVALRTHGPHRLEHVAGVSFVDERGETVRNAGRPQIKDLDSLPWPDREAIDTARYVDVWRTHHGMGSVSLITARGCPYKCNWCSHAVYGFSHRRRSPIGTADEVQHIVERWTPDQVWYADDVFTMSHKWLFEYRDEMRRRGLRIPFETISRADRMLKEPVVEALADLGCYRIWIGSESGSQRILDAMQRGVTVEEVQRATKLAQQHGIEVGMFLMFGYDGETIEDIDATVAHVKESNPDIFFTTVSYPIKGTGYYEKVDDRLVHAGEWAATTDREITIRGRHSRRYYAFADAYLRHAVAGDDTAAATARADMLLVDDEVEA